MEIAALKVNGAKGFAIIDAEDYERVSPYKWQVETNGRACWYHIGCRIGDRGERQKCIRLSHMILEIESGGSRTKVSYINGNRFDLRKENLSHSESDIPSVGETKLYFNRDKNRKVCCWVLTACRRKTQFRIGYYKTEEAVRDVIEFITDSDFSLETKEEIEAIKPLIRAWALEKGYTNPPRCGANKSTYEIGDERTIQYGFIQIKTEKGWQLKHHFIWKRHGRKIPKGHKIIFKDSDKRNFDINNLELVSDAEIGHRLSLRNQPEAIRPLLSLTRELQQEIDKQSKKKTRLLKVIGTDKLATVDTADYEKVKNFEWKLLNKQGKKVVGLRVKIGYRQYKIATLGHKIFDIDPNEKVRVTHKNKRSLDYRRTNLDVRYFDRADFIKPPSYYKHFVKNRKGSKSNWKVDIFLLNRHSTLGYYLTEDSAKAVVDFAKTLELPLTNWDEYCIFREEIRRWAIENGHATQSLSAKGRELRKEKGFNFFIRFCKRRTVTAPPWSLTMRHLAIPGKKEFRFGYFITEAAAKEAIEFIDNCGLPLTGKADAEKLRSVVLSWALAKGYVNPPHRRLITALPTFSFNSMQSRGENLVCQTQ